MRDRYTLLAAVLAALAVMTASGCRHGTTPAAGGEAAPKTVVQVSLGQVTHGGVRAALAVTGTLAPLPDQEARVAPLVAGRVQHIYVKTGDQVERGQVLATLESGALLGQIRQAEATVQTAEATVAQARLNLRSQQRSQSAAELQARANIEAQQVALDKLLAGSRPQEIAQAQTAVTAAEAALTSAQQSLARSHTLFAEGLLARKDLEAAQSAHAAADAQLKSAQAALSLAKQGNRPEDIRAGRLALQQARDQLTATRAQSVQTASKEEDVHIAERQLAAAQGALQTARAQVAAMTIRSPLAGTVVGRTLNPGESVDVTGAIVTIVNLARVRALLNVPAAAVAAVRPGMPVEFTADALPGVVHHATVSVVNRSVDPTTNTVSVEALVENPGRQLRDDGAVRGTIITAAHPGVLLAPAEALVTKDGKPTVFVVGADNVAHAHEVSIGIRDGARVEVLSGLKAGDRVVTTGAYELEDGMNVRQAQ